VVFILKDNNKNTEARELPALELVSLLVKRNRLQWFGHVEHEDAAEWLE